MTHFAYVGNAFEVSVLATNHTESWRKNNKRRNSRVIARKIECGTCVIFSVRRNIGTGSDEELFKIMFLSM